MFPPRYSHRKLVKTAADLTVKVRTAPRGPSKLHSANERISKYPSSPRPISTSLLQVLPPFQIWPINLVIFQGSYPLEEVGELIFRPASRLDAFSGYPIRT